MDCDFCKENQRPCLVPEIPDPVKLIQLTPRSIWYTPLQLGETFGYSAKQIFRLARDPKNKIIWIEVEGKMFILICTFKRFMDDQRNNW